MKNQLVRMLAEHPLAILPAKLEQIEAFLHYRMGGGPAPAYEAAAPSSYQLVGQAAVVPIMGTVAKRMNMMSSISGGASIEFVGAQIRQAVNDPSVRKVILQIDSPGGSVYGVQELADEIYAMRSAKPIIAVADDLAASAAYWIGSAASEFVVTPSGEVGSIGVVAMHVDYSGALEQDGIKVTYIHAGEHKVEGNPYEPLGDDARGFMQKRVDEYYDAFVGAVARNRGVRRSTVIEQFGGGRVFGAEQAKAAGMVDRIATLADVIRGAQPRSRSTNKAMAAEADIAAARLKAS